MENDLAARIARLTPKEITPEHKDMLGAFDRYLCAIKPSLTDKASQQQYIEVKYARARTYFESQHWEEAAAGFRDIALNHAGDESAIHAAQLYLESLNILAVSTEPARPACYDDMAADVPKLTELYCAGGKEKDNADSCVILFRVQRDVERLSAGLTVARAEGKSALQQIEKGADAYMSIWSKYGERACEDDAEKARRLGKVLMAMGEAYFFAADQKRKGVERLRFPEYKGSGTRADVLRHIKCTTKKSSPGDVGLGSSPKRVNTAPSRLFQGQAAGGEGREANPSARA